MSFNVEKYCSDLMRKIPQPIKPKKVMRIRERNVDFGLGKIGILKRVMAKRFMKNGYTHVQLCGVVHETSISKGFYDECKVWIEPLK